MTDAKTKALEFFKDWSNYLLVTTVAALGWVAAGDIAFSSVWVRAVCILAFSLSIVFGILTLALIPLVQEQRKPEDESNYDVPVTYRLLWSDTANGQCKLKSLCFPQHVLFLLGIVVFAAGTIGGDPQSMGSVARWCIGFFAFVALCGAVWLILLNWSVVGGPWRRATER